MMMSTTCCSTLVVQLEDTTPDVGDAALLTVVGTSSEGAPAVSTCRDHSVDVGAVSALVPGCEVCE